MTSLSEFVENVLPHIATEKAPQSVCEEAHDLTSGARQGDYGHPFHNFARTAGMLNEAFVHKLRAKLTPEDIATIMIILKLAREIHKPKRDNRVDIAGYANTADMIHTYRQKHGL